MSDCTQSALGERLLMSSEAEISADPELSAHRQTCEWCRAEGERRVRIQAHWDRRPLSTAELRRLRIGLPSVPQRRPLRRAVALLAVPAVVLLAVLAAAATFRARHRPSAPLRLAPAENHAALPVRPMQAAPALTSAPPLELPPVSAPSTSRSASRPALAPTAAKSAAGDTDPRWTRVTEALRRHDSASAEQALRALSTSNDRSARDPARLTLAELWLHSGRAAQARPVLLDLAQHGATPVVRARAASLLAEAAR